MGLTSTDSITVQASTVRPGCVEPVVNFHPCSVLYVRDDADGTGLDIALRGGDTTVKTLPACSCARDGIRSGTHLVEMPDGTKGWYTEPVPRCFTKQSDRINFNGNIIPPGGTAQERQFVTGPVTLEVKTGCYPQKIDYCISVCAFQNTIATTENSRPEFWIGEAEWQASINNVPYNTETQQTTETHENNYCEVFGNGGNIYRCARSFVLPAESKANFALRINVRNIGPLGVASYPLRVADAFISATCTEITSLAEIINPTSEFC